MKLGDLEASDERANLVDHGFCHLYAVRRGSGTKYQLVRPRKGAICRVVPYVAEKCLVAHLEASKANLIDRLRRERPAMLEDRRYQSVLVVKWPADDNPVQRPVSFQDGTLKDLGKVDPLCLTHVSARIDECHGLLSLRVLHHVHDRSVRHILDIFGALPDATSYKVDQARLELGFPGFDYGRECRRGV